MSIYRGRNKNEIYLASLLYDAIEDLDLRSVKTLLSDKGADPNLVLPKKQIAPFHLIIGNDSEKFTLEVTLLILQHGGNPNVQSDDGLTPVHIAAAWGRYEILKLLLDSGGNPEVRDINRKTPLHYAMEEKYPECYELLKLYVTDKADVIFPEKEDCINYTLTLDKILVNNGTTVGEYEIVSEYKTDSIYQQDLQKLQELPQPDVGEYVLNWFNSNVSKIASSDTTGISDDSGDSFKESDEERHPAVNPKNICFRKVYRKKARTPSKRRSAPISTNRPSTDVSSCKNFSKESGVATLPDSSVYNSDSGKQKNTSSDYVTCTTGTSPDVLERNIFDFDSFITNDGTDKSTKSQVSTATKSEGISSGDSSFVSVSEVYKYVDSEEGIVLFERRFLKTPVSDNGSVKSGVSGGQSLPETIDYEDVDPETIRKELTLLGYNPGPVTVTTKRVYLKKLKQLQKQTPVLPKSDDAVVARTYPPELEKTLRSPSNFKEITSYRALEEAVARQFAAPDPSRKWRGGLNRSSFTYLLLDPRVTADLPLRAEALGAQETWRAFLSAVFYVGKGTRARPYAHLYEAARLWNSGQFSSESSKLGRILDIWREGGGVVCLHLFQSTPPAEALTREAAIVSALGLENLCNERAGNFYGPPAAWGQRERRSLGVYLLYKAMAIFLNEGERQLRPADID